MPVQRANATKSMATMALPETLYYNIILIQNTLVCVMVLYYIILYHIILYHII